MYQHVLVPLDGSELAERSLSEVIELGRGGFIGEVILLKVIDVKTFHPSILGKSFDFDALRKDLHTEAGIYFESIQARLRSEGINATTVLLDGDPAEAIIEFTNNRPVDLIVISTHGYTGIKKLVLGSVAFRVLHNASTSVLLIRSGSDQKKT